MGTTIEYSSLGVHGAGTAQRKENLWGNLCCGTNHPSRVCPGSSEPDYTGGGGRIVF